MHALLVFESEPAAEVARAVAEGLGERVDCLICTVEAVPLFQRGAYDVIVVGGPASMAAGLIRGWTERLGNTYALVSAAYDVRAASSRGRPASTARVLSVALRKLGSASVARPRSFETDREGKALTAGEYERAREWGTTLGVLAGVQPLEAVAAPHSEG